MNHHQTEPTHGQLLRVVRRLAAFAPKSSEPGEGHLVPVPAAHLLEAEELVAQYLCEQESMKVRAESAVAVGLEALKEIRRPHGDAEMRGLINDAIEKMEG